MTAANSGVILAGKELIAIPRRIPSVFALLLNAALDGIFIPVEALLVYLLMNNKLCCVLNCATSCIYCDWKCCIECMSAGPLSAYSSHMHQALSCPKRKEINTDEHMQLVMHTEDLKHFYGKG